VRLLAFALLIPSLAAAQGLNPSPPGGGQKRTNYALQSNSIEDGAGNAVSPWTWNSSNFARVAGVPASMGGGNWVAATNTVASGGPYVPAAGNATPASATSLTLSAYMKKASGTGYASIIVGCGVAPNSCTCLRDDGGACTPVVHSTTYCRADVTDLGTTPIRLTVFANCSAGSTSHEIVLIPGQIGVAVGTTHFAGVQLELGARSKPSKICVTTTAARTCR
jgi:hypothetical protein